MPSVIFPSFATAPPSATPDLADIILLFSKLLPVIEPIVPLL